jgi:hypothetical protein
MNRQCIRLLLIACLALLVAPAEWAYAQRQSVNCSTSNACNATTGPSNTSTGDPAWKAFGKLNANDTQLYNMFGATGLLKGNGAVPNAMTLATLNDFPSIANATILGNGAGTSSAPVALQLSGNLKATPSGLTTSQVLNAQVGTTYTIQSTDAGSLLLASNAGSIAWTLPQAGTTGFAAGFSFDVHNEGAGTLTITPTTSTIDGGTSLSLASKRDCTVTSDGTNYRVSACTALVVGGGGGSSAWNTLTSGTNTTGAFLVGSGATLGPTGTGTITATSLNALTGLPPVVTQSLLCNGSGSSAAPVACTLGASLLATASGIGFYQALNPQTGTTYTVLGTDSGKLLTFSNGSAVAVTLPQAGTTGFGSGFAIDIQNKGAGTVTVTPTTSTVNGSATLTIAQNRGCTLTSDGTNYQTSACTAQVSGGGNVSTTGTPAANQLAQFTNSTTIQGITIPTLTLSVLQAATAFTASGTGCTPTLDSNRTAFTGLITLASGPCTAIVITPNGATNVSGAHGFHANVSDRSATTIPAWGESTSSSTTVTIPVPAAAGTTDVLSITISTY